MKWRGANSPAGKAEPNTGAADTDPREDRLRPLRSKFRCGQRRTVSTKSYNGFMACSSSTSAWSPRLLHAAPGQTGRPFDLITNLEPYLTAIESPDSEVAKARVRSLARRHPSNG